IAATRAMRRAARTRTACPVVRPLATGDHRHSVSGNGGREFTMTTLPDRPNAALIIIDVQNGVVDGSHNRDDVVANINVLLDRARGEDVAVVWVQHTSDDLPRDSEVWQYVPELVRKDDEPLVHKRYGDSF